MPHDLEIRTLGPSGAYRKAGSGLRAAAGEMPDIEGDFIVFNSLSEPIWDMMKEEIVPEAVDRTLREKLDQLILEQHDKTKPLGSREMGTLTLTKRDATLFGSCQPVETSYAKDLVINMRAGNIKSASFGFYVMTADWRQEDGWDVRVIRDLELVEVSVVTFPAYRATKVGVRSLLPDNFPNVGLVSRAINRLENKLDVIEEDRSVLLEYRSLLSDVLPPDVMQRVKDIVPNTTASPVVPIDVLRKKLDLETLDVV